VTPRRPASSPLLLASAVALALAAGPRSGHAQPASEPAPSPGPDTTVAATDTVAAGTFEAAPRPGTPQSSAGSFALRLGLENVRSERNSAERVSYENRRFRHSLDALGRLARGDREFVAYEQRLGLTAATIERENVRGVDQFRVRYPSDFDFKRAPRGPRRAPTSNSVDLIVGPLFAYDLGRVTEPISFQIQTEITARYNPWPGGRLTGSILFPMYNDFIPTDLNPDVDNVRPGLVTVEQFAWVPRTGLFSGTMGLFADNRFGISVGAARPFAQGALLLDAQADLTGFVAFNEEIEYSDPNQSSGFAGVTWRPGWGRDVAVRARVAKFLYGDEGGEVAFTRSFGDLDLVLAITRSRNLTNEIIRIVFPIPPMNRGTGMPVRPMPVERFPLSFRVDATPLGVSLTGAASREEFLRQLSKPSLEANRHRYDRARGLDPAAKPETPLWANHQGMSGFVITPWAGVRPESEVELGYTTMPKKWSYMPGRGVYHNEIYYASFGLLPRLEAGMRVTRTPGFNPFGHIDPLSELSTDTDHMISWRFAILEPRVGRPGLAVGMDDSQGTRRYHAAYLVSGLPFEIFRVQNRFSLGYASRVFTASRYVLDGAFSAIEVSPWRSVAARFEYDTEKLNVGLGVDLGFGLRIRAAALNMESLSAGVGWHHKL
jgi:hypothetical protein